MNEVRGHSLGDVDAMRAVLADERRRAAMARARRR